MGVVDSLHAGGEDDQEGARGSGGGDRGGAHPASGGGGGHGGSGGGVPAGHAAEAGVDGRAASTAPRHCSAAASFVSIAALSWMRSGSCCCLRRHRPAAIPDT